MIKSNSLQNAKEITFIQKRVTIKSKSVQKTMMEVQVNTECQGGHLDAKEGENKVGLSQES